MAVAPVNFYSSFDLVPIFEWVLGDNDPTKDATNDTPPVDPVCTATDAYSAPQSSPGTDTPPPTPGMKLVFVGFEWRPVCGIATWPRPDWMDGITAGYDEWADPTRGQDDDERKRTSEADRARRLALAQHRPAPTVGKADNPPATNFGNDADD